MAKLYGVEVGAGAIFSLDIDLSKTVDDLKTEIKAKIPGLINCDAALIKVYLAKEADTWLDENDGAIKALTAKSIPDRIRHLMQEHLLLAATTYLNDDACFGTNFETANSSVHLLVECPSPPDQDPIYRQKILCLSRGQALFSAIAATASVLAVYCGANGLWFAALITAVLFCVATYYASRLARPNNKRALRDGGYSYVLITTPQILR